MDLPTLEQIAKAWKISVHDLIGTESIPELSPEQVEAQEIAEAWPWLTDGMRANYKALILEVANARKQAAGATPGSPPVAPETARTRRKRSR
jgi:hypothetical protein